MKSWTSVPKRLKFGECLWIFKETTIGSAGEKISKFGWDLLKALDLGLMLDEGT